MDNMKNSLKVLVLLLLIFSAPSQATDISQLPVDSLGTVKPNIIIGFDDSGSMANDYLPDTASNLASQYLASHNYNPLAYNPNSTYLPWIKAVATTTTATIRYPNASYATYYTTLVSDGTNPLTSGTLTSGKAYQVTYTCGSSSYANSYNYETGAKFTSRTTCQNKSGSTYTPASNYTILAGQSWQGMTLNAPTYYEVTATATAADGTTNSTATTSSCTSYCTVVACPSGDLCSGIAATNPDTGNKLKKITISQSDTAGLQNYANWLAYHSQRKYMVSAAMSDILPGLKGISMGIIPFNSTSTTNSNTKALDSTVTAHSYSSSYYASTGKMFNLDYTGDVNTLLDIIYNTESGSATPTHANLKAVGTAFSTAGLTLSLADSSGTITAGQKGIVQFACQKNAAFVMTDGYANETTLPAAITYSNTTWGAAAPYSTIYTKSLADIALAYYTLNIRPDLATGKVPSDTYTAGPGADKNTNLHMNTYALTLGVHGSDFGSATYPTTSATANAYITSPTWQNPTTATNNVKQIDDLWHATINGRGQMFSADNPDVLVTYVKNAFMDIVLRAGSQSAIAVANVNLTQANDYAYGSSYNPTGWFGDVQEFLVDLTTGAVNNTNPVWSARDQLDAKPYSGRNIFTINNVVFGATAPLPTLPAGSATGATVATLVNYLKGDRSNEANGTNTNQYYRVRTHVMGDAINAEPLITNNIVYQATNDGMLHAFSAANGSEKWAYVPSQNIPNLGNLSLTTYNHQYFVDSTPVAGKYTSANTLLVGGLGAGKFGYYAIDVTTPATPSAKWEFPQNTTNTQNGGMTSINKPRLIATKDASHPYVVVITSGYNNGSTATGGSGGDGKGHIWLLNPADGSVIRELKTPDGTSTAPVGLSTFAAFVANATTDNTVSYLYGGDELGNVWKIDASATSIGSWTLSKFATVGRPITVKPELTVTTLGNPIILFGTGRLFGLTDITNSDTQGFYAIQDMQVTTGATTITSAMLTKLNASGGDATDRTLTMPTGMTCNSWNHTSSGSKDNYGWYFDFPQGGERVVGNPTVGIGHIAFNTNLISANSCASASYSYWLSLNVGASSSNSCSLPIDSGSNMGRYLGGFTASRPVLVSLPSGKIELLTHLGSGTILTTDTGAFNLVTSAIRSWRSLKRPMR
jgi:type IV pilus assembly protein PilY1